MLMPPLKKSRDLSPHFERIRGRRVFHDRGWPSLILTAEIPWWKLEHGRYRQTMGVYDYLYPAAARIGMNALKVPVKWAQVEPKPGRYDFSYVDHVIRMARKNGLKLVIGWFGHYASGDGTIYRNLHDELFAPLHVIEDDRTYPRAVDADGIAHHNAASYACPAIVRAETSAFRAFMKHMKRTDGARATVQMVQLENEIAQFGADRENRKHWRDHRPEANRLFRKWGFRKGGAPDLLFTARLFGEKWLEPIASAGKSAYPLPTFLNYVSGLLGGAVTGGSPGEDIATHRRTCPSVDFIGRNLYMQPQRTASEMRSALKEWCVGGNLPAITETNSGSDPVAPRLAYLAIGEFGAPLFAPWALNVSYPHYGSAYVLEDGTLANGAFTLRDVYLSLRKAEALIAHYATTDHLKVYMSEKPGERFRLKQTVGGIEVSGRGPACGQGIVMRTGARELVVVGFNFYVSLKTGMESWPKIRRISVLQGSFRNGDEWVTEGVPKYAVDQSAGTVGFLVEAPSAIRVRW